MLRILRGLACAATALLAAVAALAASSQAQVLRPDVVARTTHVTRQSTCPQASTIRGCVITTKLWTTKGDGYRGGVLVGTAKTVVNPGTSGVTVSLNRLGRRLLRRHAPLPLAATTVIVVLRMPTPTTPTSAPTTPTTTSTAATTTTVTPAGPTLPPCGIAPPVPPAGGPGPAGVVGGIYIIGGPVQFQPPNCVGPSRPATSVGGTVEVLDAGGNVVATQTVATGQTFTVSLPPGTYTAQASMATSVPSPANAFYCKSQGSFTVTDGKQTPVEIVCNVP